MAFEKDTDALRVRIAIARSERDAWQASGRREKYLLAHSLVEALERRLMVALEMRPIPDGVS